MEPSKLTSLITAPTDETLQKINFAELYVQIELKAVMKVKLLFFKWFEDLIRNILKNNQKFLKKEKKKSDLESEDHNEEMSLANTRTRAAEGNLDTQADLKKRKASTVLNLEEAYVAIEDTLVNNPQVKLQCVMCRMHGEYTVTGRLIPF